MLKPKSHVMIINSDKISQIKKRIKVNQSYLKISYSHVYYRELHYHIYRVFL